jgi:hypothetical protein
MQKKFFYSVNMDMAKARKHIHSFDEVVFFDAVLKKSKTIMRDRSLVKTCLDDLKLPRGVPVSLFESVRSKITINTNPKTKQRPETFFTNQSDVLSLLGWYLELIWCPCVFTRRSRSAMSM